MADIPTVIGVIGDLEYEIKCAIREIQDASDVLRENGVDTLTLAYIHDTHVAALNALRRMVQDIKDKEMERVLHDRECDRLFHELRAQIDDVIESEYDRGFNTGYDYGQEDEDRRRRRGALMVAAPRMYADGTDV